MLFDGNTGPVGGMCEYISAMGHGSRAEVSWCASTEGLTSRTRTERSDFDWARWGRVLRPYSVATGKDKPFGVVSARVEDGDRRRWLQDGRGLASAVWHAFFVRSHRQSPVRECLCRRQQPQRDLSSSWTLTLARRPLAGSKWSSSVTSARSNFLRGKRRVVLLSDVY